MSISPVSSCSLVIAELKQSSSPGKRSSRADEAVARLRTEAARRGVTLDDVVTQLAETLDRAPPPQQTSRRRKLQFVVTGSSTSGRGAADTDEMLADEMLADEMMPRGSDEAEMLSVETGVLLASFFRSLADGEITVEELGAGRL